MEKITLEQALNNIEIVVLDHFRGSRKEHIALEQSLQVIKDELSRMKSTLNNVNKDVVEGC